MYIDNFGKFTHCIVALFEKQTTQVIVTGNEVLYLYDDQNKLTW